MSRTTTPPRSESTSVERPGDLAGHWRIEGNHLDVQLSDEAVEKLNHLLRETRESPADMLRKALGLYKASVDAHREGKAVGIAASAEMLETEFVGL